MKFKLKQQPVVGDTRTISKFAFLPIRIENEIRWLERVKIKQQYVLGSIKFSAYDYWRNIEFISN